MRLRARGGWGPALRIARRQVRRNLGRSVLIAVLVGLPVAGATIADVLYRSVESPERNATSRIGAADAVIEVTPWDTLPMPGNGRLPMVDLNSRGDQPPEPERDAAAVDVAALLPPGTVLVPDRVNHGVRLDNGDTVVRSALLDVGPLGGPLTDHTIRLESGRWPEARDEAAVTPALADRLGLLDGGDLRPDATVTISDGPTARVTAVVVDPFDLGSERLSVAPDSAVAEHAAAEAEDSWGMLGSTGGVVYLADLPDGVDVTSLAGVLAADGVGLLPRGVFSHPEQYYPDYSGGGSPTVEQLQQAALVVLVVGLGLLEVVLLAGAAFAVGARRQVRELGLMMAGGASAAHVRRTVLAQGLVLGVLGAATGLAVGAALVPVAAPSWERYLGELVDHWTFGWAELAAAAGVGVLSGLAAAVVPAIGAARMKPVDALAQRFRTTRLAARLPVVGVVLFVVGAAGALIASRAMARDLEEYGAELARLAGTGLYVAAPASGPYTALQLGGALIATAGIVVLLPGLISVLARTAHRLGLSARLALRDAARHRHRTAPAVAAIAIVVAGSTAVAFGAGGTARADELRYTPSLPADVMRIDVDRQDRTPAEIETMLTEAEQAAAGALPGAQIIRATEATSEYRYDGVSTFDTVWLATATDCIECPYSGSVSVAVADPDLLELVTGRAPDQAILDAVADGTMVVFEQPYIHDDGTVHIETYPGEGPPEQVRIPARLAERSGAHTSLPGAVASAETLTAHGFTPMPTSSYIRFGDATQQQIDAALGAAESVGAWPSVEVPLDEGVDPAVLALTAGAAFVTLVGVAIAVALAAAEGRADLATLAAVGAPPRRRRSLAGAQALVVGGLGVLIGSVLGVYFAYLIWPALGAPEFIWAWDHLLLTGVAVPVLAVLVAVVFTPSRLPMIRRVE
ncbi:FtsX-like permease family protein [Jiangella mangrovi]|uniref:Putative ABC transport system permease protein n=1 Tax=Jiangella mangrovi TaxID=1524084 RepID=A0A7W9GPE1_9ACTN|nr:FtsX-like permease family protein [Jiangella mangrovi]MBB5787373.1 putative ABC transport system permease protein [Jiangella mangrovi]